MTSQFTVTSKLIDVQFLLFKKFNHMFIVLKSLAKFLTHVASPHLGEKQMGTGMFTCFKVETDSFAEHPNYKNHTVEPYPNVERDGYKINLIVR